LLGHVITALHPSLPFGSVPVLHSHLLEEELYEKAELRHTQAPPFASESLGHVWHFPDLFKTAPAGQLHVFEALLYVMLESLQTQALPCNVASEPQLIAVMQVCVDELNMNPDCLQTHLPPVAVACAQQGSAGAVQVLVLVLKVYPDFLQTHLPDEREASVPHGIGSVHFLVLVLKVYPAFLQTHLPDDAREASVPHGIVSVHFFVLVLKVNPDFLQMHFPPVKVASVPQDIGVHFFVDALYKYPVVLQMHVPLFSTASFPQDTAQVLVALL